MDADHARLEQTIRQAASATDDSLPTLHAEFVRELAAHFAREEELMQACGFPGLHCHLAQHKLLVEEARRGPAGNPEALRKLIGVDIAQLVESHVLTLDSITAAFIRGELAPSNFDNLRLPVETSQI